MQATDLRKMCAESLLKLLCEGQNIELDIVDNKVCISSTGVGVDGIKYHLKDGDDITVLDCYQYVIECDLTMDEGSTMNVDEGGKLIIKEGCLILDGCLTLDGQLKFKC